MQYRRALRRTYAERRHSTRQTCTGSARISRKTYAGALNDTLVSYLRKLRPTTTVAALTNNWTFLDRLLARHGLRDLFDVVVNSAEVGCCKPNAEIFKVLLERLRRQPGEVLFIDDHRANVDAAAALGFRTIHFQTTESALVELHAQLSE